MADQKLDQQAWKVEAEVRSLRPPHPYTYVLGEYSLIAIIQHKRT